MRSVPSRKRLIISAVLLFISFTFIRSTISLINSSKRLGDLKNEVILLDTQKSDLLKSIEYKQTAEFIEEKARNDFNLVKPGEKVYVLVGEGINDLETLERKGVLSGKSVRKEGFKSTNVYQWIELFF